MPKRARFCPGGYPVHLIQRGNNRQAIFTCDADLAPYANWLAEGAERFGVLAKVRHCANTGLVLGTEAFREQVSRLRN